MFSTVNLSIKGVPTGTAEKLRLRAEGNHRSLQGELMAIIEQAAQGQDPPVRAAHPATPTVAGGQRVWMQGHKSVEQLMAERLAAGWTPHPTLAQAPLAVDIVRGDRDTR